MKNWSRRDFIGGLGNISAGLALSRIVQNAGAADRKPTNFVVIYMDDMGYGDPACYGGISGLTPNLDRMAREGMRFSSFYVAQAVCSASRAALLTGCYSNRVGISGALGPNAKTGLDPQEDTIADVLKRRGYACGIFGKWHLGDHQPYLPLQQGFDEYFGLPYSNDMWPVDYDGTPIPPGQKRNADDGKPHRSYYPPLFLMENNEKVREVRNLTDQDELTTLYTERATGFIAKHKDKPFFLYLPHTMVHVPLGVSAKFRGKSGHGLYSDVLMEIDWSVGRILETLKEHGLEKNTLVVFASDNGPWRNFGNHAGSPGPLREGKMTMWEGGCRVPCIARWPGFIPAGVVCNKIASTIDLLPTLAEIAGARLPERRIDGVSILSLLQNKRGADPRRSILLYYGQTLTGVREGKWKLQLPHKTLTYEGFSPGSDGIPGPTGNRSVTLALYNMDNDVGEQTNLADRYPEVVARLRKIADAARADLGDTGNPGPGIRTPASF